MEIRYEEIVSGMDKYPFDAKEPVDARYTRQPLAQDEENRYIEALPAPLTEDEILSLYYKGFPIKPDTSKDVIGQLSEIQLLREVRFPLPFDFEIEMRFSSALAMSYRARQRNLTTSPAEIRTNDSESEQASSFRIASGGDTGIGLTLLGIGGCGKSEAVRTMLSRYPQVIYHNRGQMGAFIQITWIQAVTPPNANLNDLYICIAAAIDEALGNSEPYYAENIRKNKSSVGLKAEYIAKLIRLFGIGALVLDEIQHIDAGRNKTESYESLMTIVNTTKVALVIVGTEEAFPVLFRKYYTARRAAAIVNASLYCADRNQFDTVMKHIMQINWFKEKFSPTSELLDAIFNETSGVIDRMISVWMDVQEDYVMAVTKPEITPDYIRKVSNSKRPFMALYTRQTLDDDPLHSSDDGGQQALPVPNEKPKENNDNLTHIIKSLPDSQKAEIVFRRVKNNVIENEKVYNDTTILKAVKRVLSTKSNANCDELVLTQKVLKSLVRKPSDRRAGNVPKQGFDLESFELNVTQ